MSKHELALFCNRCQLIIPGIIDPENPKCSYCGNQVMAINKQEAQEKERNAVPKPEDFTDATKNEQ